jgi:hypothetical protein
MDTQPLPSGLSSYRQHLVLAEQKAQDDYDKTVLSLSGGALGVSFAFVDKFIKGAIVRPDLLVAGWTSWAISLALVLVSFYVSRIALHKAIDQTDRAEIRSARPGGFASLVLHGCNSGSGISFLAGLVLVLRFVWLNAGAK